ncbi:MAG: hypothetical protein OXQ93_13935 [Gemmatimonadota bacterium]|nr:hypothetical protein [Gemmatimonadota bacterium]
MSLKSRLDAHLDASDAYTWARWGDPHLYSLIAGQGDDYRPAVVTRYTGSVIIAGRRRPRVDVTLIVAPSTTTVYSGGAGVEALEDALVLDLDGVPDAYPRLLPSQVVYDYRAGGVPGKQRYLAVVVPVLGP